MRVKKNKMHQMEAKEERCKKVTSEKDHGWNEGRES
jgi:hypothetical protein